MHSGWSTTTQNLCRDQCSRGEVVLRAAKSRVRGLVLFNSPHPTFSHPLPCDRGERIENTTTLKILVPHWLNSPVEPNLDLS